MAHPHDCAWNGGAQSQLRASAATTPSVRSRGRSGRRVAAMVAFVAAVARATSLAEAQSQGQAFHPAQFESDWYNGESKGAGSRDSGGEVGIRHGSGSDTSGSGGWHGGAADAIDEGAQHTGYSGNHARQGDEKMTPTRSDGPGDAADVPESSGRDLPPLPPLPPLDGPPMALLTATTPANLSPDDTQIVTVPEGAEVGDLIEVETEDGDRYFASLPSGIAPGETFEVYTHTMVTEHSLVGLDHDEEDLAELYEYQQGDLHDSAMDDDTLGVESGDLDPGFEADDDTYEEGDDWEGGEGGGGELEYDDVWGGFYNDTDRRHYGPGLDTVWFGNARMLVARSLYATNCIQVGGGKVPYYEYCEGCMVVKAQRCISDMRSNISKNVPYGCDLNTGTQKRQPQCCPTFVDNNHFHSLEGESAAYNDALLCLANIGCQDSAFYHQIEDECHFNGCDVVPVYQEDDMEVWDDTLDGVDDNKFQDYDDDVSLVDLGIPAQSEWSSAKYWVDDDVARKNPTAYQGGKNKGSGDNKKHSNQGRWRFVRDNMDEEAGDPDSSDAWQKLHKKYREKWWELRPSEWKRAWGKEKWFDTTTDTHDLDYYVAADQKLVRHRRYPKALRPGRYRPWTWVRYWDEDSAEWDWKKVWRWKKYNGNGALMVDACMVADTVNGYEMFSKLAPMEGANKKENPRYGQDIWSGERRIGRNDRYWSRKLNDDDYLSKNRYYVRASVKKQYSRTSIHQGENKDNIWRTPARCRACTPSDRSGARGTFASVVLTVVVSAAAAMALGFDALL